MAHNPQLPTVSPRPCNQVQSFRARVTHGVHCAVTYWLLPLSALRDLEITTELTERAPEPQLSVGVRQGGQPVTGELNVNPGTALQMDVYLDKASAPVYGLLVSYMQVTDTKSQEETIIFNG